MAMSGFEQVRRDSTPISTNNPFRQSMLLRAESPFDDELYANPAASISASSVASSRKVNFATTTGRPVDGQAPTPVVNPFAEPDSVDMPPPYDDKGRSNSVPSTVESEKARHEHEDRERERTSRPERDELLDRRAEPRRRSSREEQQRYREERDRLRQERDRLRSERDRLRSERDRLRDPNREGTVTARPRDPQRDARRESHRNSYHPGAYTRDSRTHGHSHSGSSRHGTRQRSKSESAKRTKDGRPLDVIDKMDVTGLFGPGSFHHDGPFDACTPHRNKNSAGAPVAAFLADGPNNSLAIVDPEMGRYRKEQTVFGRDPEDMTMFSDAVESFDPLERAKPVHGEHTLGLGSTTFVGGTVASAAALDEADKEDRGVSRSRSILRRPPPRRPELTSHNSNPENQRPPVQEERSTGLLGRVKSLRLRR